MKRERPGFQEAIDRVRAVTARLPVEHVAPLDALGRRVTEDVAAAMDHPRFDMAAMDGYALRACDAGGELVVAGEARAGAPPPPCPPASAIRISTGSAIPQGADAVAAHERVSVASNGTIRLDEPVETGRNIRQRGEDARGGEVVVCAGATVTPAIVAALTCYGVERVPVRARPRLALLATGDELDNAGAFGIADANGPMVVAMAHAMGLDCTTLPRVGDDAEAVYDALRAVCEDGASILLTSGGVSAGAHDHVRAAIDRLGGTVHFHGVAMRPGKPMLFASLPSGSLFFGLPGNPVAAMAGFRFFVVAAIREMLGLPAETGEAVVRDAPALTDATRLLKAGRMMRDGRVDADVAADQRSHTLRPLIDADSWLVAPPAREPRAQCRLFAILPDRV